MRQGDGYWNGIKGSSPQTTGTKPKVHTEGRVCEQSDCTTRLSRYNPARLCYLHEPVKFRTPRARKAKADAGVLPAGV